MNPDPDQLAKAERLYAITQKVGFALWQLQELEGSAALYYVLVGLAKQGMGQEAADALVEDTQSKTFGATITKLVKGKHLSDDLEPRFTMLLKERNWLVHSSRATNRDAIHSDAACTRLLQRLKHIVEEASLLLNAVSSAADTFVRSSGVSVDQVPGLVQSTLRKWHGGDAT